MNTFDLTYLVEKTMRLEAVDIRDAKKRFISALTPEQQKQVRVVSIYSVPYVEPVKEPEPEKSIGPRDCQCPDCASPETFSVWSEGQFHRRSYRDIAVGKPKDGGPNRAA